jgi:WD40 repeat protein
VTSVAWSPDGGRVALGEQDGSVRVRDPDLRFDRRVLAGAKDTVASVAWSPDGHRLAIVGDDPEVMLWSLSGDGVQRLGGHAAGMRSVFWSPTGRQLATGGADATTWVWSTVQ